MVDSLSEKQARFVSLIFSALIVLITIITGWQVIQIREQSEKIARQQALLNALPKEYLMLEQYRCDQQATQNILKEIKSSVEYIRRNVEHEN